MVSAAAGRTWRTAAIGGHPDVMGGDSSPEHLRLFIAINPPDPVSAEIAAALATLRQTVSENSVRWTKPEQLHLTLKFLGNIKVSDVEQLVHSVRSACQSEHALELQARGIGFFPNAKSPRVVWVGVSDPEGRLALLHQAVQRATLPFGQAAEERFSGHITLGRIKTFKRKETALLAKAAEQGATTLFGQWTAREVHLMRSQLSAGGAEHTIVAAVPLVD